MKKNTLIFILGISVAVFSVSCSKEDKVDPNEEELITTVKLSLLEQGTSTPQVVIFKDIDGPGGATPVQFDSIIINSGKSFTASLQFLNESVSPADDITTEVAAEGTDHQIYYEATAIGINVVNLNADLKGLPLGLTSIWNAVGTAGKGKMKITLKHKPGAKAAGDPVSKGETDIEVEFGVRLK